MVALARFHDTGARSDFHRPSRRCAPVPSTTISSCSPSGPTPKPPFDSNKRLFNGAAGWPDLAIDQAARPRSSLARYRLAATADGFALPLHPPPLRQASRPLLFCDNAEKSCLADFEISRNSRLSHRNADGNPSSCAVLCQYSATSVAAGQHPKPPYYSPDPFQYRTLTYVRLSELPQYS
jgi:hypothetical protein